MVDETFIEIENEINALSKNLINMKQHHEQLLNEVRQLEASILMTQGALNNMQIMKKRIEEKNKPVTEGDSDEITPPA